MWFAIGYAAVSLLTMAGLSFQRGHKDAKHGYNYGDIDFIAPFGIGLIWPLTFPTYLMYKVGYATFNYQEAKRDEQARIANEKRKHELTLAKELAEVDKFLEPHKNM